MDTQRVCARIDLDAIEHNIKESAERLKKRMKIVAVIKTDGYGHGAVPIARHIMDMEEIYGFAVATCEEAVELIEAGVKKPILILGYTFEDSCETVIKNGIRPTIFTREMAMAYEKAAQKLGMDVYCHIKIDTGMGRIGYPVNDKSVEEICHIFKSLSHLKPDGIFTHFARADEQDKRATKKQHDLFSSMIERLEEEGLEFTHHHCANSAAIMEFPTIGMDLCRLGISMYGLWPSEEMDRDFPIRPALSLHSHIVHLKTVEPNTPISYGGTFVTERSCRIATVPVGYGDGYSRGLSNCGEVLIHGKRCPIVGRVCMDQFMVDVSEVEEVRVLDEVTLLGTEGTETITLEELGEKSGRFNYEFACCLGNRIPRQYYRAGELIDTKEYY